MIIPDKFAEENTGTVKRLSAAPIILELLCSATGLRVACMARVDNEYWTACEVRDEISFGIKSGTQLKIKSTLCYEALEEGTAIIIENVEKDQKYYKHPAPALYGFQSYVSVPIKLSNGSLFGTLCAFDPDPAVLSNKLVKELFEAYAKLIAYLIDADDQENHQKLQRQIFFRYALCI